MKHLLFLLPLLAFGHSNGSAADTDAFEYRRRVETKITEEGLGTIELDREIFSRTRNEFSDLRLFQEKGGAEVAVPFVIERIPDLRPGSSPVKIATEVLSFEQFENGDIEIRIRLRKGGSAAALIEVKTPIRNFEKNVSVSAVDENGVVNKIVTEKLIFDYDSFLDFRNTAIPLPANECREFVVRVSQATDRQRSTVKQLTRTISPDSGTTVQESESIETRQFRIDELSFYTAKTQAEATHSIRSERFELVDVDEDPKQKQTRILLKGDRVPVDSLILQTGDRNFKRRIELQIPVDRDEDRWRTIHTATIHRYDLGEVKDEKLTLSFSEQRSDFFRLLIHNRDSPRIAIQEIVGVGEIYELRFIADPIAHYALLFGGGGLVNLPDYDVAAIEAATSGKIKRLALELAAVETNPAFKLSEAKSRGLNQRWILWMAIAIVVSGLVWVLLKTAKQIDVNTD